MTLAALIELKSLASKQGRGRNSVHMPENSPESTLSTRKFRQLPGARTGAAAQIHSGP